MKTLVDLGVPPAKVFVEPYGVDQSVFAPSTEKFDRFSVVWASSFTQTKGLSYLMEALASPGLADAELVLAGYPSGKDAVSRYEGRIRVRRVGRVARPELGRVMGRSHVHVFPTLLDGFGRNIIEAMASGLPVVATSHCAAPDLIEDGKTGFIVPIRDVGAIVERLRWLKDHPREGVEMGLRACERVKGLTQADYRRRFAERIAAVWSQDQRRDEA
jgi:glycosyltransferase involved in cell wall biosynthesis